MNVSTRTQVPCGDVDFDQALSVDYMDPCATGGCLASPECSSGGCRLEQLDGRWTCCQCGRGGNEYRWCRHRMRKSPDTFCYHVCCVDCRADADVEISGGDGNRETNGTGIDNSGRNSLRSG
jgi:hypothetical protein